MISRLNKLYLSLNPFIRFLINGFLLFLVWTIFYSYFRNNNSVNAFYEYITLHLGNILLSVSKYFLNLLGYKTLVFGKTIKIVGTYGVYLDKGCLGRNVLGLFAGFLIAYPGKITSKLWFIPLGLLIINIINVFRITGLALTLKYFPQYVDINHHIIFQVVVLSCIFIMWYWWISKFGANSRPAEESQKA